MAEPLTRPDMGHSIGQFSLGLALAVFTSFVGWFCLIPPPKTLSTRQWAEVHEDTIHVQEAGRPIRTAMTVVWAAIIGWCIRMMRRAVFGWSNEPAGGNITSHDSS